MTTDNPTLTPAAAPTANVAILRKENVQAIIAAAPEAYDANALSSRRCIDFGSSLLSQIEASGMTDDLDRRCADYIDKARRTLRAMNERRAPVTKLFDEVRSQFTAMENMIDPGKSGNVVSLIQQHRNSFATMKHKQAEQERQQELLRRQRQQAHDGFIRDVEDDYKRALNASIARAIDALSALNKSLTLANFDSVSATIRSFAVSLPDNWATTTPSSVHIPALLTDITDSLRSERKKHLADMLPHLAEQYAFEVGDFRDSLVDALPARKEELERIAAASADEATRLQQEIAAREAAEMTRLEQERKRKEDEARAAQAVKAQAGELTGLFEQSAVAAAPAYELKTSVKLHAVPLSAEGVLALVSFWWSKEGQYLPVDELCKIFKKPIAFCDKVANDKNNPEKVSSAFVRYDEEIKAK